MATNTNKGHRTGSVRGRSEIPHPNNSNHTLKRDTSTGQFMGGKEGHHKGVAREQDGRKN